MEFGGSNRKVIGHNAVIKYIPAAGWTGFDGGVANQPGLFWYFDNITNLEFTGLEFDMRMANGLMLTGDPNYGTNVLWFQACNRMNVHHNYIHDNGHAGIRVLSSKYVHIESNIIGNTDSAIFCEKDSYGGIGSSSMVITNNIIYGGTSEGIGVFSYGDDAGINENWVVSHNLISKPTSAAFNMCHSRYGQISNNVAINCYSGMHYADYSNMPFTSRSTDIDVTGNQWINMEWGLRGVGDRCAVTNNTFKNIKHTAVKLGGFPNAQGADDHTVRIKGIALQQNRFYNCSYDVSAQEWPVIDALDLDNSTISDNLAADCVNSSVIFLKFRGLHNVQIYDNNAPQAIVYWQGSSDDLGAFQKKVAWRNNAFYRVAIDMAPINPAGSYNHKWNNNNYTQLDDAPTSAAFYPLNSGGIIDLNTGMVRDEYIISATSVTGIRQSWFGREVRLVASAAVTLVHSATLSLAGAVNLTLQAGQTINFSNQGTTTWKEKYRSLT
jgi:hypothetical protein